MKTRQISKVIFDKITALAIAHPAIQKELMEGSIVTGGCIASMLLKEKVNDYDVYFKDIGALTRVIQYFGEKTNAKYLVAYTAGEKLPHEGLARFIKGSTINTSTAIEEVQGIAPEDEEIEEGGDEDLNIPLPASGHDIWYALYNNVSALATCESVHYIALFYQSVGHWVISDAEKAKAEKEEKTFYIKFASANAVTLSDKVQLVFRFFGPADEIHKNYDFVHATNYWTQKTGLVTNTEALEAILARELIYKGSRFPLASIFRTRKFIQRGWTLHIANYVKMAFQLNELDLKNLHVLREQLTGVDAAYLNQIIMQCERADVPITCSYVCELVDRLIRGGQEEEQTGDS